MKMYNHRNNTNSAWAFTLTLLLIFTALFGGFSPLGISGEVDEAYAADDPHIRTATLDLTTGSGITIDAISTEGWAWDGTTTPMILTLSGINLSTASKAGIIVPSGASIVVTGTNTIESATTTAAWYVFGIHGEGDLTIIGDGTLTVTGGATTNSTSSYGIYIAAGGDLTISGSGLTVNATGGTTEKGSFGIWGDSRTILSLSNATVNATGGTAEYDSFGIQVGDFTMSGGTVAATGDSGRNSYGIYSWQTGIINGGVVNATGGAAEYDSFGIRVGPFTMSNGTVTATGDAATNSSIGIYSSWTTTITGGEVNATGGNSLDNHGIYSYSATTITGGEVNATGGNSSNASYGIFSNSSNIEITGGEVNATGGNGLTSAGINVSSCAISNGTVNATGGNATNRSIGIQAKHLTVTSGSIVATGSTSTNGNAYSNGIRATVTANISGGTVTATGGNADYSYGITDGSSHGGTLTINGGTVTATAISGAAIRHGTIALGTLVMITSPEGAGPSSGGSVYFIATVSGGSIAATNVAIGAITEDPGSGSSGGSGGVSTPTTVINTNTGSVTENQLKNAAGAAKTGDTVTIQSNRTNEVIFPASGLGSLAEKDNSLTVVTENGTLTFDSRAVSAMGAQATTTDIQVMVEDVDKSSLTEDQQVNVGDKRVYDLTVLSGGKLISNFEGGKVSVNIPYELEAGETAEKITVWYMGDDGSLTEITCTYDATTRSVTFVVDHFSKYLIGYDVLAGWVNPFHDVMNDAWYYQAVAYANEKDLMKGQTNATFGPQIAMTRGMLVTILGRMEGVDTTVYAAGNTFSDVDNHQYYAPYIAWASEKDIVNGMGEDRFAPNAAVTREQMAVMITNYLTFKEQGPTGTWAILLTYGDLDKVSSWANEGVMFMTMKALMKGMGDDKMGNRLFAPNATSTRAQTAQVMMNLDELLQ